MSNPFTRISLIGKAEDASVGDTMVALVDYLLGRGIQVRVDESVTLDFPKAVQRLARSQLVNGCNLLVAIGGDGTMLYAAQLVIDEGIPLLGINRGRLGFLTDVSPDEMKECFDDVLAGNYRGESRLLLEVKLVRDGETKARCIALNDAVVQRWQTGRILDFETSVNGDYVNTHGGDGLIVATATGSTAYALSGGGPIIQPELDAMVLVPICPHTLSDRPIVLRADSLIEVKLPPDPENRAQITCDGRVMGELTSQDQLLIQAAEQRVTMIHPPGHDYYKILRSKLHWGRSGHRRRNE